MCGEVCLALRDVLPQAHRIRGNNAKQSGLVVHEDQRSCEQNKTTVGHPEKSFTAELRTDSTTHICAVTCLQGSTVRTRPTSVRVLLAMAMVQCAKTSSMVSTASAPQGKGMLFSGCFCAVCFTDNLEVFDVHVKNNPIHISCNRADQFTHPTSTPRLTGTSCEVDVDECASSPCLHGNCSDALGGYSCACDTGYQGETCDVDVDDCVNVTCPGGNRSACVDLVGGFRCGCVEGFMGVNCTDRVCKLNMCRHRNQMFEMCHISVVLSLRCGSHVSGSAVSE